VRPSPCSSLIPLYWLCYVHRMQYYPIFLDLRAYPCLVIGGGTVAERKVQSLLQAHGQVTVISPTCTPQLRSWAVDRTITLYERPYCSGDLQGFSLVFAATSDETLHEKIAAEARGAGVLLNVVDRPALCSFIMPAVVSQGDLTLAISTGGASPALAKKIRQTLERHFNSSLGCVSEWRAMSSLLRSGNGSSLLWLTLRCWTISANGRPINWMLSCKKL
jgi:precorrin-2 dehydrogenase/sirohydrochlorin ferrochelatase